MKNILLLLSVCCFAVGCSKDDGPSGENPIPAPNQYFYSVALKGSCDTNAPMTFRYCVSKETLDEVKEEVRNLRDHGVDCANVTFLDIDGVERSGIYKTGDNHINWNPCAD